MREEIDRRVRELAVYIAENNATVRDAAAYMGVSKSTVHKDISERLPYLDRGLFRQVRGVLEQNKAERHLRGGDATRKKYKREADEKASPQ